MLPPSQNILTFSVQILSHNIATLKFFFEHIATLMFPSEVFSTWCLKYPPYICKWIVACGSAWKLNMKALIILLISVW